MNLENLIKLVSLIGGITGIFVGLVIISPKLIQWIRNFNDWRSLRKRLGAELYTTDDILKATRYYIKPDCQDVDPTQEQEIRLVHAVKASLFKNVDQILEAPSKYKFIIILADSGMGKTSFVLNYYARHWRSIRRKRKFNIALIPLGIRNADDYINEITEKSNTILFLDAFDEDTLAIEDHKKRLENLLDICSGFRQILITCRTQFFIREEEIPKETGIARFGITSAGESHMYEFYKLYLSPFSDDHVISYLKMRFSIWRLKQRRRARNMVLKIPLLSVRPMLLAHIKDLVKSDKQYSFSFQLYEEMIEAWLDREESYVGNKEMLRRFSELLAYDLYMNREERGAERINYKELKPLADRFSIPLKDWQLRSRSLLNRDASGNYKFAHRSIMEFLFVIKFLYLRPSSRKQIKWTDQMYSFLFEIIEYNWEKNGALPNLDLIDLSSIARSGQIKRISFRSSSEFLTPSDVNKLVEKFNFYESKINNDGKGIPHLYRINSLKNEDFVIDYISGLMWQKGGSSAQLGIKGAEKRIDMLNEQQYGGFKDWKLPTLEEAMSLMSPKKYNILFIDRIFSTDKDVIFTSDISKDDYDVKLGKKKRKYKEVSKVKTQNLNVNRFLVNFKFACIEEGRHGFVRAVRLIR